MRYLENDIPERWTLIEDINTYPDNSAWWERFGDPLLDSLIERGLENNYDVIMAGRRIEMARAAVGKARAAYYPQINNQVAYTRGRRSGLQEGRTGNGENYGYFSLNTLMSWEIDIFGKISAQVKEQKANVRVSRAERDGVETSLAAEIASTYVSLRVMQAELSVAREHSLRQDTALKIAVSRFDAGLASMMDVEQARQVYYSTIASIPLLESNIYTGINALSVLLCTTVDELRPTLEVARPMPDYIQAVQTGTPAGLLRQRPDIRQAEEQIGVYAAQLGIARKDWLPTLSLSASAGSEARNAGDLLKRGAITYTIAPTLSWTVFDGLERKYATQSAHEALRNAVDNYNLTVLTAIQEVDNAMSDYLAELHYIESLKKLVEASAGYDQRALSNYKNGLSPYINVADAQMSYLENMNTLIVAKGKALSALIELYKALGGGYLEPQDVQ